MIALTSQHQYFLYRRAVDMRKSFDGLSGLEYLADILQKLPTRNVNDVEDLLPGQWTKNNLTMEV